MDGVVEGFALAASILDILDDIVKFMSDNNSKKSISRCNTVKLVKCRLENIKKACGNSNSLATGELAGVVQTSLMELGEIASNLKKRVSSGARKAIMYRLVQGSFNTQIELLRKGLADIEGALKLDPSMSSGFQANALMSHSSNGQASTSTPTPHVQNNFYIHNVTVTNGQQAPEYNNYPGIQYVPEGHAQITQAAPGNPYAAPPARIGYPRY